MENKIDSAFLFKRGMLSRWEELNPILEKGEPAVGYEVDENENIISYVFKIGDGQKTWSELAPVASDKEIELSYDNFDYEINNLVNAYIILGPPQEDGTRLPAAGMLYSTYGLGDTPGAIEEYDVTDHLIVEGKSSYAVGRNIKILDDPNAEKPDERIANYATAFGAHHNISGYGSFTAGVNNDVTSHAKYGVTLGNNLFNTGSRSVALGESTNRLTKILSDKNLTIADIASLTSEDFSALLTPERTSMVWGDYSFISGRDNIAFGHYSAALGEWLFAGGDYSTVFGYANKVFGNKSAAFGDNNIVKDNGSLVLGGTNIIDGEGYNTAIGFLNTMTGKYSLAAGYKNTNNGDGTVALGWQNIIGEKTSAQGSVVTGKENIVDTGYAFASGTKSYANHYGSSVLGMGLKSSVQNGTVVGQFNQVKKDMLFAVGNGSGTSTDLVLQDNNTFKDGENVKRSNAFEVYRDGHAEVAVTGNTDNAIITRKHLDNNIEELKSYTDNSSVELKNYIDTQTTTEIEFSTNSNTLITLEDLEPSSKINAKINYIASQNDIFQNGTFENETVPTEWAQIVEAISDDPWDAHSEDGINKVGRIGSIDATSNQYTKYYKGKMNIEINRTYILEMKVCGKIGISLVGSQGIGEGSGWTIFESPSEEWQTFRKQFTCIGRADGSAEHVGWTMGFGLPKGQTTEGAFIDDVKIYPLCEVKFQEGESSEQTVYFADPDNGNLPTFETTANSVTIYTFDNSNSLGIEPVISGSYTKNIKSILENVETIDDYVKDENYKDNTKLTTANFVSNMVEAKIQNIETGIMIKKIRGIDSSEIASAVPIYLPVGDYTINNNTITFEFFDQMYNFIGIKDITITSSTLTCSYNNNQITFFGYGCPTDCVKATLKMWEGMDEFFVPMYSYYNFDIYLSDIYDNVRGCKNNTLYYIYNPSNENQIKQYLYKNNAFEYLTSSETASNIETTSSMGWGITKQGDKILYASVSLDSFSAYETNRDTHTVTLEIPLPSELQGFTKFTAVYNEGTLADAIVSYCSWSENILLIRCYSPREILSYEPVDGYMTIVAYS